MKIRPKKEKKKRIKRVDLSAGYCEDEDEPSETTIKSNPMCNLSRFLKSNCQIVLMPGKSSKSVLSGIENNLSFDDTIFFIKDRVLNDNTCPVCLDDPVVPVITKCGHTFCYICITQAIIYVPPSCTSTCPVCSQPLSHDGIRLVIWRSLDELKLGENITMSLCTRNSKHSLINIGDDRDNELPVLPDKLIEVTDGNWYTTTESSISSRDFTQILKFPKNNGAIISMLYRVNVIINEIHRNSDTDSLICDSCAIITEQIGNLLLIVKSNRYKPETIKSQNVQQTMFYQYSLGHNVFLHPRNFQQITTMLKNQSKSLEHAPRTVSGTIVKLQNEVMNNGNPKRYRFLSHLPINAEFTLCLLSLTDLEVPPIQETNQDNAQDSTKEDDYSGSTINMYEYIANYSYESHVYHHSLNSSLSPFMCTDEDFPSLE